MSRRERDLRRLAREHGWRLERRSRHWALRSPAGDCVIAAKTPGDSGHLRVIAGAIRRVLRERAP